MLKGILIGITALWFLGCVDVRSELIPEKHEEAYLQATRKTELITQGRVQVVLIATYLNMLDAENYPEDLGEVFFIDVFQIFQHGVKSPNGFFENGFQLFLSNGERPTKITPLKKEQLEGLMQENATPWGEYYHVEFPPQDRNTRNGLVLLLEHEDFGRNYLNFGFKTLDKDQLKTRR